MPNFSLRAGLVGLFYFIVLTYTVCALPIPGSHLVPASSSLSYPSGVLPLPPGVPPVHLRPVNSLLASAVTQGVGPREALLSLSSPSDYVSTREDEMVTLHRRNIFSKLFHKIKEGFQHVGKAIKNGIVHAAKAVAHGVAHAAKVVAHGVSHAATAVKHFVQTTGAKIAKVGLKIASVVEHGISKVASFIPGVGKVVSKVMDGISTGASKLSDKIKAHVGGKLGEAMKKMDKANHIMSFIPRELSVEPVVQVWPASELEEREPFKLFRRCQEQL